MGRLHARPARPAKLFSRRECSQVEPDLRAGCERVVTSINLPGGQVPPNWPFTFFTTHGTGCCYGHFRRSMNWLTQLLTEESVARTVILLGVAGAAGAALGKIRVRGVSLGVAGVLFVGLLLGHLKLTVDAQVLDFVRECGLVVFLYALGLQIGPGFFGSLRARGLMLNGLAAAIVLIGGVLAAVFIAAGWVGLPAGVGLLSGATTSTPTLAAAQQALQQV